MTSALNFARLAALIAILGFFMPWAEVSCSGQPMVHATGIQLITGGAGGVPVGPVRHDLWVAAALALTILALAGGLLVRGRGAAMTLAAAALAAAAASLIGASQEVPSARIQAQLAAGPSGDAASRQAAGELISARLEYGYFVTLGGLIVAIAGAGLALAGRRLPGGKSE
jgi:hypothetical protein